MKLFTKTPAAVLAAALVAGCATTGDPPGALQQARQAYETAQQNPHVPRFSPVELNQAGRALDRAEAAWRGGADPDALAHEAYLARQQALIAVRSAEGRAARAEIEDAETRRRNVLAEAERRRAEAREREAEVARRQATQDLQQAEQARKQAEAAREQALQERQQAEAARQKAEAEIRVLQKEMQALQARPTDGGWVLTLGAEMLFDVGDATLKPGARRALENLAQFLKRHPDRTVVIDGFTDNTGSDELNQRLSQRRAESVKRALVEAGIEPARVDARGHGDAFPVASNDSPAGRQLNRRVEIQLPNAPGSAVGPGRPAP